MPEMRDALQREVEWSGRRATIIGCWEVPTYLLEFDDGSRLTVGTSKVTFLPTETCPHCLGSGRVSVGPWGARPPRTTCPTCQGRREVTVD